MLKKNNQIQTQHLQSANHPIPQHHNPPSSSPLAILPGHISSCNCTSIQSNPYNQKLRAISNKPLMKYRFTHPTNQPATNNANNEPLDPLTARTYLTSALSQFLGLTGTSISIDILKISSENAIDTVWIRIPRPDGAAVVAALSSWIGGGSSGSGSVAWRVCGKGNFLNALIAGDGADLFVP